MPRVRTLLCLLALPLLASATPPAEPALKEVLKISVRGDSGGAQRFTVVTRGFHVFSARRQKLEAPSAAPDTLTVAGIGTVEIVSAESGKPIILDAWVLGAERSETQRFSGHALKIERASLTSTFVVTDR